MAPALGEFNGSGHRLGVWDPQLNFVADNGFRGIAHDDPGGAGKGTTSTRTLDGHSGHA